MARPLPVRLHATVRSISAPFDAGRFVELKLELLPESEPFRGIFLLCVPAAFAKHFAVDDCFCFPMTRVK